VLLTYYSYYLPKRKEKGVLQTYDTLGTKLFLLAKGPLNIKFAYLILGDTWHDHFCTIRNTGDSKIKHLGSNPVISPSIFF
jgi:hypothetical protein